MKLCKSLCFCLSLAVFSVIFSVEANAQDRSRIVKSESRPINAPIYQQPSQQPQTTQIKHSVISLPTNSSRRPALTNEIEVVRTTQNYQPLVKKTGSSQPTNSVSNNYISKGAYSSTFNQKLLQAIQTRIGIPYRYGSEGPTSYDCSGLVWSVFGDAGFSFERTSARTLWQNSEPVEGDDRFKVGTLVFFNKLAHIGIVADTKGFYHASSSQGVTYSTFEGYWSNKIVGFRRMKINSPIPVEQKAQVAVLK
jgi:cell wall-associated NlpC family hydrolase